jgi:type IV pilus assembly protein PilN
MASKLLNIEVGDRLTKVCLSAKHGKTFQILDSFMFETPDKAVADGQVVNPAALAERLGQELEAHGANDVRSAVFTLSSAKVATREVMLPPVKDNRIKTVVETNAADYFPVDMSTYRVSCNLLERVGGETPGCRVLVMAAPRMLLESCIRLAEAAGLQTEAIDFCGNSQYQVLRGIRDEGVVMYVDVNVTNTFVTFLRDGVLLLQRNFAVGGDELVTAALHAAGRGDGEYLKTLQDTRDAGFLNSVLTADQQSDSISRLVSGIVRSADFFKSDHMDTPVSKVVVMGTCGDIAGLREEIEREIGLDTVGLHDVEGIHFVANSVEGVSSYISCIGSLVAPLDLLPEEFRAQKKKRRKDASTANPIRTGAVLCALCVLVGIGLSAFSVLRYFKALDRQQQLEQRIAELDYVGQTYQTYVNYQKTQQSLEVVGAYADNPNAGLSDFLTELEQKMPSGVLMLAATCDSDGVSMNITAPGLEEAAVVISQLRSFETIQQMTVSAITESTDDTGYTTASFSVSCGYQAPETQDQAAAAQSSAAAGSGQTDQAAQSAQSAQ